MTFLSDFLGAVALFAIIFGALILAHGFGG